MLKDQSKDRWRVRARRLANAGSALRGASPAHESQKTLTDQPHSALMAVKNIMTGETASFARAPLYIFCTGDVKSKKGFRQKKMNLCVDKSRFRAAAGRHLGGVRAAGASPAALHETIRHTGRLRLTTSTRMRRCLLCRSEDASPRSSASRTACQPGTQKHLSAAGRPR